MEKLELEELAKQQTREILTYLEGRDDWQIWKRDVNNRYCISKVKESDILGAGGKEFQKIHVDGFETDEPLKVVEYASSHKRKQDADSTITTIGRISKLECVQLPEGSSIVYQLHEGLLVPSRLFVFFEYKMEKVSINDSTPMYSAISVLPVPSFIDGLNDEIDKILERKIGVEKAKTKRAYILASGWFSLPSGKDNCELIYCQCCDLKMPSIVPVKVLSRYMLGQLELCTDIRTRFKEYTHQSL